MEKWPPYPPKNIIVRMPNWLGDLVMATPILKDLRQHYPDARLTVMCQSSVAPLLEHDPHIDELYGFSQPSGWVHRIHDRGLVRTLRRGKYDLGILLTNSLSSAWWFWRGRVRSTLGYTGHWRKFLLDRALPFPENRQEQHLVITYKQLLAPLGIPVSETAPYLVITDAERQATSKRLKDLGIEPEHLVVGINPGAAYGSAKCWLPERYRAVAERLIEDPRVRVIFFGDRTGASLVKQICEGLPESVVNIAGKSSLRDLLSLIKSCKIFLTNDSGPMHIASALGVPLLALFGSTSDVATGPYAGGAVLHKHVECAPCYKRTCPIDFRCMKRIGVDEVYLELKRLLNES